MAVVFSLENCLFDARHREKLLPDWDAYHSAAVKDQPVEAVARIVLAMWQNREHILIITSLPERLRRQTVDLLTKHAIPHHKLFMAADFDERPSHVIKKTIALGPLADEAIGNGIACVFDSHQQDVQMWRDLGFLCLQVRYPA